MSLVLFLDFDDVICLNNPFGGYDALTVLAAAAREGTPLSAKDELWDKLFDTQAVAHLRLVHDEFSPRYVLSTSWRWFFDQGLLEKTLELGGLGFVAQSLHRDWTTPQISRRAHRAVEINGWLEQHPEVAHSWVVLDDGLSGTGFDTWTHERRQFVVLCQEGVGFQKDELQRLRRAFVLRGLGSKP